MNLETVSEESPRSPGRAPEGPIAAPERVRGRPEGSPRDPGAAQRRRREAQEGLREVQEDSQRGSRGAPWGQEKPQRPSGGSLGSHAGSDRSPLGANRVFTGLRGCPRGVQRGHPGGRFIGNFDY